MASRQNCSEAVGSVPDLPWQAAPGRENAVVGEDKANKPNGATEPETASGPASEGRRGIPPASAEPVLPPAPQVPKEDLAPPPDVPKEKLPPPPDVPKQELPPPPEVGMEDLSAASQVPVEGSLAPPRQVPEGDLSEAPSGPMEDLYSVPEVPSQEPSSAPEAPSGVPSPPAAPPGTPEASESRIGEDEIGKPDRPDPGNAGPRRGWRTTLEEVRRRLSAPAAQGGLIAFLGSGVGLAMLGSLLLFLLRRRSNSRANQTIRLVIEHGRSGLNGNG